VFSRSVSVRTSVLSGMDMSGRVVLHRQYNALVHDQRGPVLESAVSDEIWPE